MSDIRQQIIEKQDEMNNLLWDALVALDCANIPKGFIDLRDEIFTLKSQLKKEPEITDEDIKEASCKYQKRYSRPLVAKHFRLGYVDGAKDMRDKKIKPIKDK